MSVLSIIGLVFVVLKLIGTIDWSWWAVLAPFIIESVVFIAGFVFAWAWFKGK